MTGAKLPKEIFCAFKKTSIQRSIFLTAKRGKFLQLAALLGVQSRWHFHHDAREQISASTALEVCNSLAPQLEDLAALRSGRNSQVCLAFERRHRDLAAERGNRKGDRNLAIEIIFIALKHRVLFDVKHDVEIARRPAADAGFAISRRTQPRTAADTRWNFQFDPAGIFDPPFAAAFMTWFFNNLSDSPAARTGLRHLEKTAGTDHLSASAAGWTIDRARAGLGAATVALIASVQLANFDFFLRAKCGFLQRDLHIVTQIGTTLPFVRATGAAATEKTLENSATAAAEGLAENIERIVESAPKTAGALRKCGVSVPIVGGTLIGVDQDVVGFAQFLKFFLGVKIIRIFIRVEFDCELAIGALDFILVRTPGHPEHFVIIAFGSRHLEW